MVQPSGGKTQVLQEARKTHVTGRGKAVQRGVTGRWLPFPSSILRFLCAVYYKAEPSHCETRKLLVYLISKYVLFLGTPKISCVTQVNKVQTLIRKDKIQWKCNHYSDFFVEKCMNLIFRTARQNYVCPFNCPGQKLL